MRLYLSYKSIPELKAVPRHEQRRVIQRAVALASAASGRRQYRLTIAWVAIVIAAAIFIGSHSAPDPWWMSGVACWLFISVSYLVVFQFQVRRLRPYIGHVLAEEGTEAKGM